MKALVIDRYGSNEVVRAGEMPDPELRDEDVLVQIHAASVNPLDLKIKDGELKPILPCRLPLILGNDLAGVVLRVGPGARRFKPGDEVYARPDKDRIGTFAELIAIGEDAVAIKPKRLTMDRGGFHPTGRLDRLASAGRKSQSEGRAERSDSRGFRWCRNNGSPVGEATWRDRGDDHEHGESRLG